MAIGDPVYPQVTLLVFDRDGSDRGEVACQDIAWTLGKGIDTPNLSATVNLLETDLAADPNLFDDALVQVAYDGAAVGQPYLVTSDDKAVIRDDDEASAITVTAKSALLILAEWQVTPADGQWLAKSPDLIFFGWQHPDFDDSDWHDPETLHRALTVAPKANQPPGWEWYEADWVWRDSDEGRLVLVRFGEFTVPNQRQHRIASTADEEHKVYLHGPGYGGVITESSKQETGYTEWSKFDRVLAAEDYFVAAEYTTTASEGGDGFDAISLAVSPVNGVDGADSPLRLSSGDAGIKIWMQDKDDPRPGLTVGKILHSLRTWNRLWMTDTSASCHTVSFSFSVTEDSDGEPWPDVHEQSWRTGTPVSQVLADLSDVVDFDCHLDEDDGHLVVDAYPHKGADLTGHAVAQTYRSGPLGVGSTGSLDGAAVAVSFIPTETVTVTQVEIDRWEAATGGAIHRVGIASSLGTLPTGIVWLSSNATADLSSVGLNVVVIPSVTLTSGVTYWLVQQTFGGGNAYHVADSGFLGTGGFRGATYAGDYAYAGSSSNLWSVITSDYHLMVFSLGESGSVRLVTGNPDRDGNVLSYIARRQPRTMTRASIATEDGYTTKVNDTAEATLTPRSVYLESQQSSSLGEGRRMALRVIAEDGDNRDSAEAVLTAVEGAVPGLDFDWGDTIAALNRSGAAADKDVVTWGGRRSGDDEPIFTVELV